MVNVQQQYHFNICYFYFGILFLPLLLNDKEKYASTVLNDFQTVIPDSIRIFCENYLKKIMEIEIVYILYRKRTPGIKQISTHIWLRCCQPMIPEWEEMGQKDEARQLILKKIRDS